MLKDKQVCLCDLKVGESAKVKNVIIDNKKLRNRFFEMGITKGVMVQVKNIAPLGDPISIYIRGYELSLRKADAKLILVEVLK